MVNTILWCLIGILVIFSAFFSSSEFIYAKMNYNRMKRAIENGDKRASLAVQFTNDYTNTLTIILIGNNLVNTAVSSIGTLIFVDIYPNNSNKASLMATLVITLIVLVFGEIIPKAFAPRFRHNLAIAFAKPLKFFSYLLFPLQWPVTKLVDKMSKIWKSKNKEEAITEEELMVITEELREDGIFDTDDAELVKSAIDFCDITAHEIMVPRVDVIAVDYNDPIEDIIKEVDIFKYSKVVVYDDLMDNLKGLFNTTTILKMMLNNLPIDKEKILEQPLYVHKTKPISSILTEFKQHNINFAIVLDEFGGFMGILTIEDILEELVGDIWDESDTVVPDFQYLDNGKYLVDGDMNIYDFFELVDYDDRDFESEYTTVGGWCTEILDRFPKVGDEFTFASLNLKIVDADSYRVGLVEVTINEPIIEE